MFFFFLFVTYLLTSNAVVCPDICFSCTLPTCTNDPSSAPSIKSTQKPTNSPIGYVLCPDGKTHCNGVQYCPGGTLCPNAPSVTLTPVVSKPPSAPLSNSIVVYNKCTYPIWIGTVSGAIPGNPNLPNNIQIPLNSKYIYSVTGWNGRLWPKSGCDSPGKNCVVGNTDNTLLEFNFGSQIYYDVSLVDGYTTPVTLSPSTVGGSCIVASCDLTISQCPPDLILLNSAGQQVACQSPCSKTNMEVYCCGNTAPDVCRTGPVVQTNYVQLLHQQCPTVYSYSYDDSNGLHVCPGSTNFTITFCG